MYIYACICIYIYTYIYIYICIQLTYKPNNATTWPTPFMMLAKWPMVTRYPCCSPESKVAGLSPTSWALEGPSGGYPSPHQVTKYLLDCLRVERPITSAKDNWWESVMGSLRSLILPVSDVQFGLADQHAMHVSLSNGAPETSTCALKKPHYHNITSLHE